MKVAYRFKDGEWSGMFYDSVNDTHIILDNKHLPRVRELVALKLMEIYPESRYYSMEEYVEIPTKQSYHFTTIKDTTRYMGIDMDSYYAIFQHRGIFFTHELNIPNIDNMQQKIQLWKDMLKHVVLSDSVVNDMINFMDTAIEELGKVKVVK